MILEKLDKKVNLKKIYIVILLDNRTRPDCQANSGAWGVGGGRKGRWLGRGERARIGEGLGKGRGEGGRMVLGAGKFISQLREPF